MKTYYYYYFYYYYYGSYTNWKAWESKSNGFIGIYGLGNIVARLSIILLPISKITTFFVNIIKYMWQWRVKCGPRKRNDYFTLFYYSLKIAHTSVNCEKFNALANSFSDLLRDFKRKEWDFFGLTTLMRHNHTHIMIGIKILSLQCDLHGTFLSCRVDQKYKINLYAKVKNNFNLAHSVLAKLMILIKAQTYTHAHWIWWCDGIFSKQLE
jgi:hypothetical protein